jgi:hypothetical protein
MYLIVYFDGQFWNGIIERETEEGFFASRYIFGAEPKEGEILDFVNTKLLKVISLQTKGVETDKRELKKINPKRLIKLAAKEMKKQPVSSKSQEAMQLQLEETKNEKKAQTKEERELERELKRKIMTEKAKNKHKGK